MVDCIFTCNKYAIYKKYLVTKGTLYHKGLSYLIQFNTKFEYILCSTLKIGKVLYFLISIKPLI